MTLRTATLAAAVLLAGLTAARAAETVTINAIDANGVGAAIGTLALQDTAGGLEITPTLAGLPPGDHGFHVHANGDCGPGNSPDGKPKPGSLLAAISIPATPASTSAQRAPATRATCRR